MSMKSFKEVVEDHSVLDADQKRAVRAADRLFTQAARSWARGNNSGDNTILVKCEARASEQQTKAEALLHGVYGLELKVDYPRLYPSFQYMGHDYIDLHSLVQWAPV